MQGAQLGICHPSTPLKVTRDDSEEFFSDFDYTIFTLIQRHTEFARMQRHTELVEVGAVYLNYSLAAF